MADAMVRVKSVKMKTIARTAVEEDVLYATVVLVTVSLCVTAAVEVAEKNASTAMEAAVRNGAVQSASPPDVSDNPSSMVVAFRLITRQHPDYAPPMAKFPLPSVVHFLVPINAINSNLAPLGYLQEAGTPAPRRLK